MDCHGCVRAAIVRPAAAIRRYCSVGLRKEHLVEMHRSTSKPLCTRLHQPERGFDTLTAGSTGSRPPVHHRAA